MHPWLNIHASFSVYSALLNRRVSISSAHCTGDGGMRSAYATLRVDALFVAAHPVDFKTTL